MPKTRKKTRRGGEGKIAPGDGLVNEIRQLRPNFGIAATFFIAERLKAAGWDRLPAALTTKQLFSDVLGYRVAWDVVRRVPEGLKGEVFYGGVKKRWKMFPTAAVVDICYWAFENGTYRRRREHEPALKGPEPKEDQDEQNQ